ncbi:unnamed protein product [Closterium sp. NIES-65]|nr:unnamed protein product [Closterium sp. NIES-65]
MGSSQPFFDWAGFPAGVRFEPTDVQLLDHLLAKLDEEHASIDDDEQTLKPGVKRQASRGKENIAGGVGSKPRVQKPRRQQHPRVGEFIPTLGFEDGICSVYPEDLPGIVTDGTTRHYFHRPSRAYAMGLRKRRKVFSDRPSAATLPPGTVGGADAGGGREECGYRWHKTGKTRPVFARNRKQISWKKILVLYEMQAQRGKRVFSRLIALTLLASPPPGPTPPLIGWKKILVLYEMRAQRGKRIGWKKILVLYETRAQRGKKRGADERSSPAGGSGKDRKTNWIMHQYHVGEQGEEKEGEWVVSKVFYQIQQRQSSGTRAGSREGSLPPLGQGADEEECGAEGREDIEAVGEGEGGGAEEEEGEEEEVVDDIEDVNDEDGDGDGGMAGAPRAAVAGRGGGLVSGAGGAFVAAGGSVVTAGGSAGAAGGSAVTAGRRGRGGRGGRGVSQGGRGGSRGGRPAKGGVLATRGTFQASQPSPTSAAAASFGAAFLPPGHHPPPLLPAASPVSTAAGAASGAISGAFSGADLITTAEVAPAGAAGALAGPARLLSFHNQAPPCGVQEGALLGTAGPPNTGVPGIGFTPFSRKGGAAGGGGGGGSVRVSTGGVTAGEITSITSNSSGSGHGSGSAGAMFLSPPPNTQRRVGLGGFKPLDTGAAAAGASAAAAGAGAAEPVTPSSTAMPVPITPPSAHSASGLVALKPPGWGGEAGRLVPCQLQQQQQEQQQQQQQQQGNHAATITPRTEAATAAELVGSAGVSDLRAYEQSLGDSASDIGSYPHSQEGTPDDYPFRFLSTPTDEHTDGSPKKTEIGAVAEETVAGATVAGGDVAGGNVAASVTSADAATADAAAVAAPATPRVPSSADVAASAASSGNMEAGCAEGGTPGVGCTGRTTHTSAGSSDGDGRVGGVEGTGGGKSLWKPAARRFSPPAGARGDARGGAATIAGVTITAAAVSDALKDSLKEPWSIPTSQDLPLPSTPIFLSQELPPIEHLPSSLPSLPPSQEPVMCFDATQPVDLGEKEGEEGIGGLGQMREIGAMGGTGENGREQSGGESEEAIQETQVEAEEVGAEAGDKSRAGTATVLGGEANMEGVREGLCGPGGGEVTGAGEGAAVGSCGVATGAVGGCGAMPGAVGSGMLGAAFWIGSSGPGMSNGTWGEWMGPARSSNHEQSEGDSQQSGSASGSSKGKEGGMASGRKGKRGGTSGGRGRRKGVGGGEGGGGKRQVGGWRNWTIDT